MTTTGGFTILDFTVPTRDSPIIHPCASAPICDDCRSQDLCFFDPTCSGCQEILSNPKTTISELFAIMRQWIPQTQRYLSLLTREVLRRGAHVDDRDSLTDLSLLHYACKAGALINNGSSLGLVSSLIAKGADTNAKCHWTDMNALHYAVYFDCDGVVEQLCEHNPALVPTVCNHFNRGNCLHIAAANLSLKSARILIKHNADGGWKDDQNRLPHECVPDVANNQDEAIAHELRDILKVAADNRPKLKAPVPPPSIPTPTASESSLSSRSTNKSSLKQTKNKPIANGVSKPEVIVTMNGDARTTKAMNGHKEVISSKTTQPIKLKGSAGTNSHISTPTSPLSSIQSPFPQTGSAVGTPAPVQGNSPEEPSLGSLGIKIGDKVTIDGGTPKSKLGTLRFYGDTMFAPGLWAGIELEEDIGRNDGSHGGIRYFSCKPKRGLFVPLKRVTKCHSNKSSGSSSAATKDKVLKKSSSSSSTTSTSRSKMMTHSLSTEYQVGERVVVKDNMGPGTVRFVGSVKFGPGVWLGVELDRPKGMSDGSNGDTRYFKCRHNYGVFVYPSKVTKISDSVDRPSSSTSSGTSPTSRHATPPISRKKHAASPVIKSSGGVASRSKPRPYVSPVPTSVSLANSPLPTLEKGMSVFTNKEKGTLQYIGHTEFAPGLWLGIELKKPSGKNDGSVSGKRYFSCRPNYGIFVKPEKVTHRGINCSKLIKPTDH